MGSIPVEVEGISSVFAPVQGYAVILKEHGGKRYLPIYIGQPEATNITLLLQGVKYVRPLTYDLFNNILIETGARVMSISVTELKDTTFYAEVLLKVGDSERRVDARPSDAIALAIKTRAPIFVDSKVMNTAAYISEETEEQPDINIRLRELNKQLEEAVDLEAFERAAKIRDKIRALEKQGTA